MATRKQRKRSQKERRHEYEKVWILPDGTVSDEPPDGYVEPAPRAQSAEGKKPEAKRAQGSRATKTPLPPSWGRAAKRSLMLGVVIFVLFVILGSKGNTGYAVALLYAVLYTALFIPFTYYVDRFAYRRWQAKTTGQPSKKN